MLLSRRLCAERGTSGDDKREGLVSLRSADSLTVRSSLSSSDSINPWRRSLAGSVQLFSLSAAEDAVESRLPNA